ncbi:MAG: ATP-dependent sacrificial sulfur transferase LarE [Candidatus Aminicenantes bacterium]|nr:ATP-dependent sacrificial sulfur transferase LarE [Candidatus Aminicenantes bacterium]
MDKINKSKLDKLREVIRNSGSLVVAFSGGVDSSLIAKVAYDELGEKSIAVTIESDTLSGRELDIAKRVASEIGIDHEIVKHSELDNDDFVKNPVDRCYHCKKEEMDIMKDVASSRGFDSIAFGVNMSDFGEYRPGINALREEDFFEPLVEAGIGKDEIPDIAASLGLSNYDLPSTTCLASRIPYGETITKKKLERIEQGENFLHDLGIKQVRVRNYNDIARIEVDENQIEIVVRNRKEIMKIFRELGFIYVSLDLEGYRSGSMNEVLEEDKKG